MEQVQTHEAPKLGEVLRKDDDITAEASSLAERVNLRNDDACHRRPDSGLVTVE